MLNVRSRPQNARNQFLIFFGSRQSASAQRDAISAETDGDSAVSSVAKAGPAPPTSTSCSIPDIESNEDTMELPGRTSKLGPSDDPVTSRQTDPVDSKLCAPGRCESADPNDIGRLVSKGHSLTDEDRLRGLKDRWVPSDRNSYPTCHHDNAGKSRPGRCSKKNLNDFPWLALSQYGEQTGAWCASCLLFGVSDKGGGQTLGKFVKRPLRCFKKLTCSSDDKKKDGHLTEHDKHPYHVTNHIRATEFLLRMDAPQSQVSEQMKVLTEHQEKRTFDALCSISETVCVAAAQNIALRGHRDDGRIDPDEEVLSKINDRNFRTLLRKQARAGDVTLAEHLKKAPRNALYTSKTSQNEILQVYGSMIKEGVAQRYKNAFFWSIGADDTTDRANTEQMAITVRYVANDKEGNGDESKCLVVKEDPVAVLNVMEGIQPSAGENEKRMSGKNLGSIILGKVSELGLQPEGLVAQSYDGAACMASERVGVVAEVKRVAPQADYFHCSSHGLNLATSKVMKVQGVKNAMGTMESVIIFITDSGKRDDALVRVQKKTGAQTAQVAEDVSDSVCRKTYGDRKVCRTAPGSDRSSAGDGEVAGPSHQH